MSGSAMAEHKRKRSDSGIPPEEVRARASALREEMEGLLKYFREVMAEGSGLGSGDGATSQKGAIACFMEESDLPLSKLVEVIHARLKEGNGMGKGDVPVAAVKGVVVAVGQRVAYGIPNPDADVLEDESPSCLWCWETREMKLLPKSVHGLVKIRRTCRKKIHERISAVSAMLHQLQRSENDQDCGHGLVKAFDKLDKVLNEADIRILIDGLLKNNQMASMAGTDGKQDEKAIIKQLAKNKRQAEKEKKRIDREHQKEKFKAEKELKRVQEEAEKEVRRREKEYIELKKQLKRQQEEAEKDQRKRQRDEAVLKRQLALQKQASMMERFLKRSKTDSPNENEKYSPNLPQPSDNICPSIAEAVTQSMDSTLSLNQELSVAGIRKCHLSAWRHIGESIRLTKDQHWGMRQKPKVQLYKELKLNTPKEIVMDEELNIERIVDGWTDRTSLCHSGHETLPKTRKHMRRKQLLQFDKSHRPAFYGVWPKKSHVVGPRHPFRMDPDLDYDVDSDEEWEEEDPGENLSDYNEDDEEMLEDCSKVDEEECQDGFFVPDGYLSEDEGVEVDKVDLDMSVEHASSSSQHVDNKALLEVFRQQKHLRRLTEHALKKNKPFVLLNFMHEKSSLPTTDELSGSEKLEQICLQALRVCPFPGAALPEPVFCEMLDEDQKVKSKSCSSPAATAAAISDEELLTIVAVIQSSPQGINKIVDTLQQKLPVISKTLLRNKVREISDYVDNQWQVKKEILEKLGLPLSPISPERTRRSTGIASFFSKRCLPPANRSGSTSQS
ncbi:hypothetical protein MLD38_039728 [Melastoma candidum]|uniref:Uncharacterized protein n=1 Tax=Melastoma candidum TaxID=119954 RepID=A0ACB9L3R1_9MYRT|nr:hypothetical protein MLD38_039728 [Melastoma candidum]